MRILMFALNYTLKAFLAGVCAAGIFAVSASHGHDITAFQAIVIFYLQMIFMELSELKRR